MWEGWTFRVKRSGLGSRAWDSPVNKFLVAGVNSSKAYCHQVGEDPRVRTLSSGAVHAEIMRVPKNMSSLITTHKPNPAV